MTIFSRWIATYSKDKKPKLQFDIFLKKLCSVDLSTIKDNFCRFVEIIEVILFFLFDNSKFAAYSPTKKIFSSE